jgi:hypothetical protein
MGNLRGMPKGGKIIMGTLKDFKWETVGDYLTNKDEEVEVGLFGKTTLAKLVGSTGDDDFVQAHKLWIKLKDAFNREAKGYDPELFISRLGSIGEKNDREVCRAEWWRTLNGDKYGDYDILTTIIEFTHDGEKLETGTIRFGS